MDITTKNLLYDKKSRHTTANICHTMKALTEPGAAQTGGLGTPPLVSGEANVVRRSLCG